MKPRISRRTGAPACSVAEVELERVQRGEALERRVARTCPTNAAIGGRASAGIRSRPFVVPRALRQPRAARRDGPVGREAAARAAKYSFG